MGLPERKKRILFAIVEEYVATGEPVGSKTLAGTTGLGLSPATIRNEMSDLAEKGYLVQPHTSAGRVPTQKAYRLYVDSLKGEPEPDASMRGRIDGLLKIDAGDLERTLLEAGRALAELTGFATVSTAPNNSDVRLRKIEFIPCGRRSALMVLLTDAGVVKSKLCRSAEELTPEMLRFFSRLADDKLSGTALGDITAQKIDSLTPELFEYTRALRPLLDEISGQVRALLNGEVFLGGESNLLRMAPQDSREAEELLMALESREVLSELLGGVRGRVEVRIGTENRTPVAGMDVLSIVSSPYRFNGRPAGMLGVIGPTRMDYARIIPCLTYFSEALGRLISRHFGSL